MYGCWNLFTRCASVPCRSNEKAMVFCVWANFVKNPIGYDGIICGYFNRVVKYLEHLMAVISKRMSWNMWQSMELAEFTLIYIGEYLSDLTPVIMMMVLLSFFYQSGSVSKWHNSYCRIMYRLTTRTLPWLLWLNASSRPLRVLTPPHLRSNILLT